MLAAKLITYLTLVVAVATVAHEVSATALDPKEPSLADALPVSRTHVSGQGRTLRTRDSDTVEDADKVEDPDAAEDVDTVEDADTIEDSNAVEDTDTFKDHNAVDDSSERMISPKGKFPGQFSKPSTLELFGKRKVDLLEEGQKRPRTETSFLPSNGGKETLDVIPQLDKDLLIEQLNAEYNRLKTVPGFDPDSLKVVFEDLETFLNQQGRIEVSDGQTALARGNSDLRRIILQQRSDRVEMPDLPPQYTREQQLESVDAHLKYFEASSKQATYPLTMEWKQSAPEKLVKEVDMSSKFLFVERLSSHLQAVGFGERLQLTDDKVNLLLTAFKTGRRFEDIRHHFDGPIYQIFWDCLLQWDRIATYKIFCMSFFHEESAVTAVMNAISYQEKHGYIRPEISNYVDEFSVVSVLHPARIHLLKTRLDKSRTPDDLRILLRKNVRRVNELERLLRRVYVMWYRNVYNRNYGVVVID